MKTLTLDLENASSLAEKELPTEQQITRWAQLCLHPERFNKNVQKVEISEPSLSIRIVDEEEIQQLNLQFRHKDKATNVLSFPCELPPEVNLDLLGDIVICAPVVAAEAKQQNKEIMAHWAHMVVHGCLHLVGYDHVEDADAAIMEALEISILNALDFPSPY
ncbi:probable rRNA maturation factor [Alteromonadaceae bacterium Bs31]|nr:probable rRNA maturation factor [Alteromonadaceae bacterium Bs31]